MDILGDFVVEKELILVPTLYILGVFLKRTPRIKDWQIPWIVVVSGIAGSVGLLGITAEAVIQGVLVSGVAVLGNQLFKQTVNKG